MTQLIRSASLKGFEGIARDLGLDILRLLRAQRLSPDCLCDADLMIPANAVRALLEAAASQSGSHDIGLRLAAERSLSNLGPIGLIAREQPTVGDALSALGHYMRLHNESLVLRMIPLGEATAISVELRVSPNAQFRQSAELAVAVLFRTMKMFLGQRWKPLQVCFMHTAPPRRQSHDRFFQTQVDFSRALNGIICHSAELKEQISTADPAMARHARQYVDALLGSAPATILDRVQELICVLMPAGKASATEVAKRLGIDRRTLDRRLAAARTTFHTEVEKVRKNLAAQLIASGGQSLTEIAEVLGFSSLSAFSRWRRNSFGAPLNSSRRATT